MTVEITSLEQLHEIELELLLEVQRVCRLRGIAWYLHGGAMLGAVRHGAAIPWDDDLDISMTRESFERFKDEALDDLDSRFALEMPEENADFFDFVPRIIDTSYTYAVQRANADEFEAALDHPAADIFVFEAACDGLRDGLQSFLLTCNYAQALGHRPGLDRTQFSGVARLASYVLPAIGRRRSMERIIAGRERLASWGRRHPNGSMYRIVDDLPTYMHCRYRCAWYEGERLIDYAGFQMPIPSQAEDELTEVYGPDWNELPPTEQRHPTHADLPYVAATDAGLEAGRA